jgi:hypothetical protein
MIEEVQESLDLINENEYCNIETKYFTEVSWIQVSAGLKLLDTDKFRERMSRIDPTVMDNYKKSFLKNHENMASICISHKDFLEYLRQN